jgi:hypothetical protein
MHLNKHLYKVIVAQGYSWRANIAYAYVAILCFHTISRFKGPIQKSAFISTFNPYVEAHGEKVFTW